MSASRNGNSNFFATTPAVGEEAKLFQTWPPPSAVQAVKAESPSSPRSGTTSPSLSSDSLAARPGSKGEKRKSTDTASPTKAKLSKSWEKLPKLVDELPKLVDVSELKFGELLKMLTDLNAVGDAEEVEGMRKEVQTILNSGKPLTSVRDRPVSKFVFFFFLFSLSFPHQNFFSHIPQRHDLLKKCAQNHKKAMGRLVKKLERVEATAGGLSKNHREVLGTTFEKIKQLKVEMGELKIVIMFAGGPFSFLTSDPD